MNTQCPGGVQGRRDAIFTVLCVLWKEGKGKYLVPKFKKLLWNFIQFSLTPSKLSLIFSSSFYPHSKWLYEDDTEEKIDSCFSVLSNPVGFWDNLLNKKYTEQICRVSGEELKSHILPILSSLLLIVCISKIHCF